MDPRTPVLVGVGTSHRPPDGSAGVEPLELMVEAALAAAGDAAGRHLLPRCGLVAVPEGNWTYPDAARLVADRVGAPDARTVRVDVGVPQHTPIAAAADRIRRGELDVALVVGGEAMASRLRAERSGGAVVRTEQPGAVPDERWSPQGELIADAEIQAGFWAPVEQYALIENARRAAEGWTLDEHLDDIAELWAAFNAVAATHPLADFAEPRTAEFLRSAGPGNRPLAFPYAKWHVAQWAVDQAGALLLCSADAARSAGVPIDRWVFPRVLVESSLSVSLSRRDRLDRWPAMGVLGRAAAAHLHRPLEAVEVVECYSCFPVAVRVQQRELGLDPAQVPTVTGGMTFSGGQFNNFTYQATAAVVQRLRADPGALGAVTTVSGLLTKPALAVWGATPPEEPALVADFAAGSAAATAVREVTGTASAPARVASFTVVFEGDEPVRVLVVADLPDGRRWVGVSHHLELRGRGLGEGLVGAEVMVAGRECGPA